MNLNPKVETVLNEQINVEWFAAYFYAGLANWADFNAYPGLKAWAGRASAEERGHAQAFADYLNDRGRVTLTPIAAPPQDWATYQAALEAALSAEQAVTKHLALVADVAGAANDGATVLLANEWIKTEQIGAEKEIGDYLKIIARGAPIDLLDAELYEA
jgi:ferritin